MVFVPYHPPLDVRVRLQPALRGDVQPVCGRVDRVAVRREAAIARVDELDRAQVTRRRAAHRTI